MKHLGWAFIFIIITSTQLIIGMELQSSTSFGSLSLQRLITKLSLNQRLEQSEWDFILTEAFNSKDTSAFTRLMATEPPLMNMVAKNFLEQQISLKKSR